MGGLYSSISEEFLPSGKLWPNEVIEKSRELHHYPKQQIKWSSKLTLSEKFTFLNLGLSGKVTISLLDIFKLEASGSAGFLYSDKV